MRLGSTFINIKTNFGKQTKQVEIVAYQGVKGHVFYESYSDGIKGFRIFNNFEALRKAYWSALVSVSETHFLSLCVLTFQVCELGNKEVLAI